MSGTITKHRNALGWAWYLDTDEGSYWVSHPVKEHIESLEAENTKLRELVRIMHGELVSCEDNGYVCGGHKFDERVRELGVEE